MKLADAYLCAQCDEVVDYSESDYCDCGSSQLYPITRWVRPAASSVIEDCIQAVERQDRP